MKAAIAKLFALLFLASSIYLLLPAGPLWYLWYGEKPGVENEADKMTIFAVSILVFGLSVLLIMVGDSLLRQWFQKPKVEGETDAPFSEPASED